MTSAERSLMSVSGPDALPFLQGLVTNDLRPLDHAPGLVWTALLTPQGKYLADFFVARLPDRQGDLLIDVAAPLADDLARRLALYRLRAKIAIGPAALFVTRGTGAMPPGAFADPRHPALGWRAYGTEPGPDPEVDWDALRVAHLIPETGIELVPDESYILECGFERLHGVDFRKGCYVGQEVTARMKHKTELKKGLARVRVDGSAVPGDEITADDKPAGTLHTRSGDHAIAWLRFDRATGPMLAGSSSVTLDAIAAA